MTTPKRIHLNGEDGFSLVEIVVAMFVLAGLALTLAPALITALKQGSINQITASATHQLSSRLDLARVQTPSCQSLQLFVAQAVPNVPGGQVSGSGAGVTLQTIQTLGACPATYPGTVSLTVTIKRTDTGATVATSSALIYVERAS